MIIVHKFGRASGSGDLMAIWRSGDLEIWVPVRAVAILWPSVTGTHNLRSPSR